MSIYGKLYDSCVCPVAEYAAGVWGYKDFSKINAIQYRAIRSFLGVHRFTAIPVLEGEMCWLRPKYRRWTHILRLWNRLVSMSDDRVTKNIFVNDYYLAMSNFDNWCTNVWRIMNAVDREDTFYTREPCDVDSMTKLFFTLQEENWIRCITQKAKIKILYVV